MFPAGSDEVVVHNKNTFFINQFEFFDHLFDRSSSETLPVESRDAAKAAVERTAAGCLHRTESIPPWEQVMSRRRYLAHVNEGAVVNPL